MADHQNFLNDADEPAQMKIKFYKETFRSEWMSYKQQKDWLTAIKKKNSKGPLCSVSVRTLACHHSGSVKHSNSETHQKYMKNKG